VTQQTTFSRQARADCARIRLEEDEASNVVDYPDEDFARPDRFAPGWTMHYFARYLSDDKVLVVTCREQADRWHALRVSVIGSEDYRRLRSGV
jgi:hypothetical protein